MCQYLNYLSHTRVLLLSRTCARASAPASPILLPQSLGIKKKIVILIRCMRSGRSFLQFRKDFYPKYCSEWLNFRPSASCFAPSAVILLLPSLKEKNEKFIKYASYTTKTYLKSSFLVSHLSSAGNTVDLRARKFCLVFRR